MRHFQIFFSTGLFAAMYLSAANTFAAYTNYNSVMLGDRASGMGGAFTALTGDPSASPFYNPATLARLKGTSLSSSVSLLNKYDSVYGRHESLDDSVFQINKGSILTIPAATGLFTNLGHFSFGLSIVVPDFRHFNGEISSEGNQITNLTINEQSLWVGGSLALNITELDALGLTFYYTSDTTEKAIFNRYETTGETFTENESRNVNSNSAIFILGHYHELSPHWKIGTSYRFRSIQVNGEGEYSFSKVGTVSGAEPLIRKPKSITKSEIPDRLAFGIAYERPKDFTLSLDVSYHGHNRYQDLSENGELIVRDGTINYAVGVEKYFLPWLSGRTGFFTDYSSAPKIPNNPERSYSDHINKLGFSANFGIQVSEHTVMSLGGYYVGGRGETAERMGASITRLNKSDYLFSFLVGASTRF